MGVVPDPLSAVRHIPVVDEKNHIVGIIAQGDVATISEPEKTGQLVREISKSASKSARK